MSLLLLLACGPFGRQDIGVSSDIGVSTTVDSETCPEPSVCATPLLAGEPLEELEVLTLEDSAHQVLEEMSCEAGSCCTGVGVEPGSYVVVGEWEGELLAQPVLVAEACETAWVELDFGAE